MSGFRKKVVAAFSKLFPVLLAVMIVSKAGAAEPPCKTLTVSGNPEYPPLLWEDAHEPEQLTGAATALLQEILEPMGVKLEVQSLGSWARVQRLARVGELDMIAGAFITSERIADLLYILTLSGRLDELVSEYTARYMSLQP